MEICPVGFFCFDKNTFILVILVAIIITVYYINLNNSKLEIQKNNLQEEKESYKMLQNRLDKATSDIQQIKNNNRETSIIDAIERNNIKDDMYVVNKDYQRVVNPLMGPERSFPYRINRHGVPINIPTRGYSGNYQQVGALIQDGTDDSSKKILPLYGKPTYPGSRSWLYYTGTDGFSSVKLPIENKGRSCQGDHGCQEIMDGEDISINGYDSTFKVNLYNLDKPRYIPYII